FVGRAHHAIARLQVTKIEVAVGDVTRVPGGPRLSVAASAEREPFRNGGQAPIATTCQLQLFAVLDGFSIEHGARFLQRPAQPRGIAPRGLATELELARLVRGITNTVVRTIGGDRPSAGYLGSVTGGRRARTVGGHGARARVTAAAARAAALLGGCVTSVAARSVASVTLFVARFQITGTAPRAAIGRVLVFARA